MEGLIVGIQVLRLEYYEIFSRFYKGGRTRVQDPMEGMTQLYIKYVNKDMEDYYYVINR